MANFKNWAYHNPVRIEFAPIETLSKHVEGQKVLLITTPGFVKRGVVERIKKILAPSWVYLWDGVKPNPDIQDLDFATKQLRGLSIDCVVALGGGSAMDVAKVLASTIPNYTNPTLTQVYRDKLSAEWLFRLPLVLIPTTSGTGAEVTPFATIWDHEKHQKYSLGGDFIYPDVALLDISLTLTLGKLETLYPALDAISHSLESLWNKNKTPVTEVFAIQALREANLALPIILKEPASKWARRKLQMASTMAGISISQTKTALAHSISYPLTSHFGVPHGLACSFMLPRLITHYLSFAHESCHLGIMQSTRSMLESLSLDKMLRTYVRDNCILKLENEMCSSERIGNFSLVIPDMKFILLG